MNKVIRKLMMERKGAAAVEFAIVLPVLLLLIFGIIEFSVLLYNKAMITDSSRESARAGTLYNWPDRVSEDEIEKAAEDYLRHRLINFGGDENHLEVDLSYGTDTNGNDLDGSGDLLTVNVNYKHSFLVLPNFVADITDEMMTARSVMRIE